MRTIDLNCDLGERPATPAGEPDPIDAALIAEVSSVNIACGGHAGDGASMRAVATRAIALGRAIGAHPSYPDRAGFGRRELPMAAGPLEHAIAGQLLALERVVRALSGRLRHVKPHGALYHAADREDVALAIAGAARRVAPHAVLVGRAGSRAVDVWRAFGADVLVEAFADRRYRGDGALLPRHEPGAIIDAPEEAAAQAVAIGLGLEFAAGDGGRLRVEAGTVCVHGDTPGAVAVARAVRRSLEEAGLRVCAPARPAG